MNETISHERTLNIIGKLAVISICLERMELEKEVSSIKNIADRMTDEMERVYGHTPE